MQSTDVKLEIHVCYCAQKDNDDSLRHWMLMLVELEAVKGDWIHSTGGPNGEQSPAPFLYHCFALSVIVKDIVSGARNTSVDSRSQSRCPLFKGQKLTLRS